MSSTAEAALCRTTGVLLGSERHVWYERRRTQLLSQKISSTLRHDWHPLWLKRAQPAVWNGLMVKWVCSPLAAWKKYN